MKKLLFSFCILTNLIVWTLSTNAQWQQTNGPTGIISSLASNGSSIFAGTYGSGIFLSTNNGATWTAVNNGLTSNYFSSLAISGTNVFAGASFVVGTGGGMYLSTNNGTTWSEISNGLPINTTVNSIAISGSSIFIGTNSGVYKSINNGSNWAAVNNGISNLNVRSVTVNGINIYAGTFGGGIFKSTNNGTSWTAVNNGLSNLNVRSVIVSGINIYAGTNGGIYKSTNNGSNWTAINNGLTTSQVNSIVASGSNVFAGTEIGGIFLSTNGGGNWVAVNNGLTNFKIYTISISSSDVFAGTEIGVFLSLNNGASWIERNKGLAYLNVASIAVSGSNIYAGMNNLIQGGVFISSNYGESWLPANGGVFTTNEQIFALATSGSKIFAGGTSGMYVSTNNGTNWTLVSNGLPPNLTINSIEVSGSYIYTSTSNGLYESIDNGTSWNIINNGLPNGGTGALAVSGSKILVLTSSGVYYSSNNGINWTSVNSGLANSIQTLSIIGSTFFAGTWSFLTFSIGKIYRSTNNGANWTDVSNGIPNSSMNSITSHGNNIYAGTQNGMFFSINNGSSWSQVSDLPNNILAVYSMTTSGTSVFAGTNIGVWKLTSPVSIFPSINLSSVYINPGTNITVTGQNFTQNANVEIKIQNANGYFQMVTNSVNQAGNFTYSINTSALSSGSYTVNVKDVNSNMNAPPKQFIVQGPGSNIKYLNVNTPLSGNSFETGYPIQIEWTDFLISGVNYPMVPNGSQRMYQYKIEYQNNGGAWNFVKTLSGSALLNSSVTFSDFLTINTVGSNFLVRITDNYQPSIKDTSGIFSTYLPINNNLQVNLLWDYSFPWISPLLVQGVAADGTARIYLRLNKINPNIGSAISSVNVSLSDGINFNTSRLGKVTLATVTNTYSDEANASNAISVTNNSSLGEYYFWYVAPDDFMGANPNDSLASSRIVTATFTVNFVTGSPQVITKNIKIVRPPLMLVHGIGGSHESWDDFSHNEYLFGVNVDVQFISDAAFKFKKAIDMYPVASFEANAFQLTNGGTGSGFGFSNSFQGVITGIRSLGYAANRIDCVCHSMGGSVLRKVLDDYSNNFFVNSANKTYNNYGRGFVNKMITIDSPHNSTPFADIMTRYLPYSNVVIRKLAQYKMHYFISSDYGTATPTDAVLNLQVDQGNGGINFNTTNLKAHLIASDVLDNSFTILNSSVWNRYDDYRGLSSIMSGIYDAAMNIETDPLRLAALHDIAPGNTFVSPEEVAVKFLDLYMTWHGYDEFVLNSDFIVPLNSQVAGLSLSSPMVSVFDTPNTNLLHSHSPIDISNISVLNNTAIGTKVYRLLNTSISSTAFGNIPATSNRIMTTNNSSDFVSSISNLVLDTNKIKIISPINNFNSTADSTLTILVHAKDTVNLSHITVSFQGRNYFSSTTQPYLEFVIQTTGDILELNTLIAEAVYKYPNNVNVYYDTLNVNVTTTQTCFQFIVQPEVMHLFKQESEVPDYKGIYNTFISNLSNSTQITASIANTSIVAFNPADNSFKGLVDGETFAIVSYQSLSDTIYFIVEGDTSTTLASFSANKNTVCKGSSVNFYNVSSGNPSSIKWLFPGGTPSTDTIQNPFVTYNTVGTHSVTLIATFPNKIDTITIPNYIIVSSFPAATITPLGSIIFCSGGNVTLKANTGTGLTYQWKKGGVDISGATDSTYTATANGTYKVVVTNTSGCTKISSTGVVVTVNSRPSATITPASSINFCSGGSVVLNANQESGLSYKWQKNNADISGATFNSYTAIVTGNYRVIITNSNNCSKTSNVISVTVDSIPANLITSSIPTAICPGEIAVLTCNAPGSYLWSNGATTQSINVNYNGSFAVSLTNSCGTSMASPVTLSNAICDTCIGWQKSLGGSFEELARFIQTTNDNGYIVVGSSNSNDYDVSGNHGSTDIWVSKINSIGNIEWQKSLGGTATENASCVKQTTDNGYVVAGYSSSNNGDVSGNHGTTDWWIVKLDSSGNIQWQKCFGGSNGDLAMSIYQTTDNGYIVGGYTSSNNGNITNNQGLSDFWVIKLDDSGNLVWQKTFGGTSYDQAGSILVTENGYLVLGSTMSNNGDVSGNHGGFDYWIIKINNSGILQWQKCLGGSADDFASQMILTENKAIIITGTAYSINGDVTGSHGGGDFWVLKLDSIGNVLWKKCYGAFGTESASSIHMTADKGFMVVGHTNSANGGDVFGNHGNTDYWVIKIDSVGNLNWQKCLGGTNADYASSVQKTLDNKIIITGISESNNGNVSGNHGGSDFWIVKLGSIISCPQPFAGFQTTNITSTSSKVKWTTRSCAQAYTVQYRVNGTPTWITKTVNSNTGFKTLTGLSSSTTYQWKVRSKCDTINSIFSTFSPIQTFTTSSVRLGEVIQANISEIFIHPNPNTGQFVLEFDADEMQNNSIIEIFNSLGQSIFQNTIRIKEGINQKEINLSKFPSGIYFLNLKTEKETFRQKIIKE